MSNDQYTPLPLSKLIAERLPELETEDYWNLTVSTNIHVSCGCDGIIPKVSMPAYTFTDCLRAIEMLDTTGWSDLYYRERQRELLEHYLADHYTIGENTVSYMTELFTKEQ